MQNQNEIAYQIARVIAEMKRREEGSARAQHERMRKQGQPQPQLFCIQRHGHLNVPFLTLIAPVLRSIAATTGSLRSGCPARELFDRLERLFQNCCLCWQGSPTTTSASTLFLASTRACAAFQASTTLPFVPNHHQHVSPVLVTSR